MTVQHTADSGAAAHHLAEGLKRLRERLEADLHEASATLAHERSRRELAELRAERLEVEVAALRQVQAGPPRENGQLPATACASPSVAAAARAEAPAVAPRVAPAADACAPGAGAPGAGALAPDADAPEPEAPPSPDRSMSRGAMLRNALTHALLDEQPPAVSSKLSADGKRDREAHLDRSLLKQMHREQMHWDGKPYEAIIFEGGGTKGMVYAGAIVRLAEAGLLDGVTYFAGTSAGAQTAMLIAVGYKGEELRDVMMNTPWDKLLDSSKVGGCCGCLPNFYRLLTQHGWCKGEVLQNHLEELVSRKVGKGKSGKGYTLLELYQDRGVILRVGACNITTRRFELLDYQTYPNMPVSVAARASSNIPVLFVPVSYTSVRHPDQTYLYVDGGLEGNIPMKSFPGKRALAFDLMSSGDWKKEHGSCIQPHNFWSFVGTILDMVMNSAQAAAGFSGDNKENTDRNIHIVKINCGNHGMLETKLSREEVLAMVAAGWDAVDDFLSPWVSSD